MSASATAALATVLVFPLAGALYGEPEVTFQALVDLRLFASSAENGWLDGGLDKLRFVDADEPLRLGAGLVEMSGRFSPTLSGHFSLAAYDGLGPAIHATEAYVQYAPVPRSARKFQARLGAFYPPLSLENSGAAWTSPYTVNFSAIDSWIGEELRTVGFEVQVTQMGAFRASAHDFALTGALFRFNDPAGTLLAWRGWALSDRQTGLFESLPLAPLPNVLPGGFYFGAQGLEDEPFVELDGRTGWYLGGEWRVLDRSRVRFLHYDNRGDPSVVAGGQWTWLTRFDHVGGQFRFGRHTELLVQALEGYTRMDGFNGPLVDNRFWAGYLLLTRESGPHRATLRFDRFGVVDEDTTPADPNDEQGKAWTAAYFYAPPGERLPWLRLGSLRLGAEILLVDSRRPARLLLGDPAARREQSFQLSLQWRY